MTLYEQHIRVFLFPVLVILAIILIAAILFIKEIVEYRSGAYFRDKRLSFFTVRMDAGLYGEYLTYKKLQKFEAEGAKFLFNAYIKKENGETTEIDVIMICPNGLFVIESKNYSGWIFGNEKQKNWYQTLPAGRGKSHKENFYNPIMQNQGHIKNLKHLLGEVPMYSVIVFSERCTLKSIQISSKNIRVVKRGEVDLAVEDIMGMSEKILSGEDIDRLYNALYPFTQADWLTKEQHVTAIKQKRSEKPDYAGRNYESTAKTDILRTQNKDTLKLSEGAGKISSLTKTETAINKAPVQNQMSETEKTVCRHEREILRCPLCGGKLVLRTAKKGKYAGTRFYGCSNYPNCRYVKYF